MKRKPSEISAPQTPERRILPPAAEKALRAETRHLLLEYVKLVAPGSDAEHDPDFLEFFEAQLKRNLLDAREIPLTAKAARAFVRDQLLFVQSQRQQSAQKPPQKQKWIQYQTGMLTSAMH